MTTQHTSEEVEYKPIAKHMEMLADVIEHGKHVPWPVAAKFIRAYATLLREHDDLRAQCGGMEMTIQELRDGFDDVKGVVTDDLIRHIDNVILCIEVFGAQNLPMFRDLIASRNAMRGALQSLPLAQDVVVPDKVQAVMTMAKNVVYHWHEFGTDSGFDEAVHWLEHAIEKATLAAIPEVPK